MEWKRFLIASLVMVAAVGLTSDPDLRSLGAEIISIASALALARGIRLWAINDRRPWYLFLGGLVSFLTAHIVAAAYPYVTGGPAPFPSIADVFFYGGYTGLVGGVFFLVRRRRADVEGDNLIDALTVITAFGTAITVYLIVPYFQSPFLTTPQKFLTAGYSVADLLLIAATVRLTVGSGARNTSYYLLAGGVFAALLTDTLFSLQTAGLNYDRLISVVSPFGFVLLGAAGLHSSMARLTDRPSARDIQLTRHRFALLVLALVAVPALIAYESVSGNPARTPILGVGAVLMAMLALGRLGGLVQAKEAKAAREAILREAAAALAGAATTDEMWRDAVHALARLVDADDAYVMLLDADGRVSPAATTSGTHATGAADAATAVALTYEARSTIEQGALCLCATSDADPSRGKAVVAPLRVRRVLQGALVASGVRAIGSEPLRAVETLALQLSVAMESLALAEELHRRRHERRFRALIEHSSDLVTVIDHAGNVSFASPAAQTLLGVSEQDMVGEHPFARVHPDDRYRAAALLDRAWAVPGVLEPIEARFEHADRSWRWFEVVVENLLDQPEVAGVVMHTRDISDRRAAQQQLEASEARFRSLVQHASDVVLVVDDDLRLTYLSPSVSRVLGWAPEDLLATSALDLVHEDDTVYLERVDDAPIPQTTMELRVRDRAGTWLTLEMTVTDLRRNPAVGGIVLNARDVTERKALEDELRHLALHDSLTGLANRTLFQDRLGRALASRRGRPGSVAVLYVDLDDFKGVNDGLGHSTGDDVLTEAALRVQKSLRPEDTAARLGGDEFAVLLEELPGQETALEVATRIASALREPYGSSGRDINVTASLGLAVSRDGTTAEALIREADVAMYLAKTRGRDRVQVFEAGMDNAFAERFELKRDLARALDPPTQLRLLYQPIVDLHERNLIGTEALIRWEHPERGLVSPVQFIPLAEDTGLIVPIGEWVLRTACEQLATWHATGAPHLYASVNLSVRQLEHPGLVPQVRSALEESGIDPALLTLEITESVLAADVALVESQFVELKALGVKLAVDDFGTGYSSLGYLHRFPVDVLKIDRSFVSAGDPAHRESILRTIIGLARSNQLRTIAEGIEDEAQAALLRRLGCDAAQGFYFSRPVPAEEILGPIRPSVVTAGR